MFDQLGSQIMMPGDASMGIAPSGGRTFYVSQLDAHLGSDSNEGTDPQYPLLTLAVAIAKCTQRRHDYIFVQDLYQDDTAPTVVNVRNVHCIGMSEGNQMGSRAVYDGQGSSCFQLTSTGGSFELAGFRLGSASSYGIEVTSDSYYNHIHHNAFGHFLPSTTGIYCSSSYHTQSWIIAHNFFSESITGDHISIGNPAWTCINHNYFHVVGGKGINITGGTASGTYLNNVFFSPIANALAAGWAITLAAANTGGMVAHNFASACGDGTGNNPYRDLSNAAATMTNGWSMNYDGNAVTDPDGA